MVGIFAMRYGHVDLSVVVSSEYNMDKSRRGIYMGRLGLEVANGLSRMKLNGQRGLGWCTGCASWPMPRVWVERLAVIWNGWV